MKNFITAAMLISFLLTNSYALGVSNDTSNHSFGLFIPESSVPFGGGGGGGGGNSSDGGSSGLSTGGIVGISVGVGGGLLALGGLTWLVKSYLAKDMVAGCAVGINDPILPVCLDKKTVDKIKSQNYEYLTKAIALNNIKDCENSKYILVPDFNTENKTFNSFFFKVPKELLSTDRTIKIKITQISDPFLIDGTNFELDSKIFKNVDDELCNDPKYSQKNTKDHEVVMQNLLIENLSGVVQKSGILDFGENDNLETLAIVVSFNAKTINKQPINPIKSAFLIELSK